MVIFQTEWWGSHNKEFYYEQTSSNKSREYQKQAAARARIWHAKNESNIYNKMFMSACPLYTFQKVTTEMQCLAKQTDIKHDKLQAGKNLVHVVRYPASDHALIHRFWAPTGSWYWFKELLNLWCTSCKRPTPEIVSRILLDNIRKATVISPIISTPQNEHSMDNKGT